MPDDVAARMDQSLKLAEGPSAAPKSMMEGLEELTNPASVSRAEKQVAFIPDEFDFEPVLNMAFLGAGQCGGRIAQAFWNLGFKRVCAFNLTPSDFKDLPSGILRHTLQVGGAAKDAAFAAGHLEHCEEDIWDLLTRAWGKDVDYGLITAGLGGGSGSGSAPGLVRIARKYLERQGRPPRVGAVVSLPKVSEGQQVCRNALGALKQLIELKASPLILVDNARVDDNWEPSVLKLFPLANALVSKSLYVFLRVCQADNATMQFDKAELCDVLDAGIVVASVSSVKTSQLTSPADISSAIRDKFVNSMLAEVNLKTATRGACVFLGNEALLGTTPLKYFEAGFDYVKRMIRSEGVLHRGLFTDPTPDLQVVAMVSGVELPRKKMAEMIKEAGLHSLRMPHAEFLGVDDAPKE